MVQFCSITTLHLMVKKRNICFFFFFNIIGDGYLEYIVKIKLKQV